MGYHVMVEVSTTGSECEECCRLGCNCVQCDRSVQTFRGTDCLQLRGKKVLSTVKMEAIVKKMERGFCVWLEDQTNKWLSVRSALVNDETVSVLTILKTLFEVAVKFFPVLDNAPGHPQGLVSSIPINNVNIFLTRTTDIQELHTRRSFRSIQAECGKNIFISVGKCWMETLQQQKYERVCGRK